MKRSIKGGLAVLLTAGTVAVGASALTASSASAATKCGTASRARAVAVKYYNLATTMDEINLWGDYIIELTEYMMENGCS